MKKYLYIILFYIGIILLLSTGAKAEFFSFSANDYNGGCDGCADSINGSLLTDGDTLIVFATSEISYYRLDADSGAAEGSIGADPVNPIKPDLNAGDKRWVLVDFSGTITVEDDAYGAGWNGDTTNAPSQNSVYDIVSTTITDLDGFPDELKNLVTAEIEQLENIGDRTVSYLQWAYLGGLDQALDSGQSPTFVGLDTDKILSDSFSLKGAGDAETLATFTKDGAVDLYYDNNQVFETENHGIRIYSNAANSARLWMNSTVLTLHNEETSGNFTITSLNSGDSTKNLINASPDGSFDTYYAGTKVTETTAKGIDVGNGTPAISFGGGTFSQDDIGITNIFASSGSDANISEKPNAYFERTANGTGSNLDLGYGNIAVEDILAVHGKVGASSTNNLVGTVSKLQAYGTNNANQFVDQGNALTGSVSVVQQKSNSGQVPRSIFGSNIISTHEGYASGDTGTHDGANNAATLTDSGASWTTDAWIGCTIQNITDGSTGTITDNDGTTITASLSGGSESDWDTGDSYAIRFYGQNVVGIETDVHTDVQMDGGTLGSPLHNATAYWAQCAGSNNCTSAFLVTHYTDYWGYGLLGNTIFTKAGIWLDNGNPDTKVAYFYGENGDDGDGENSIVYIDNQDSANSDVLTLKQSGEAGGANSDFIEFHTSAGKVGDIDSDGSGTVNYNGFVGTHTVQTKEQYLLKGMPMCITGELMKGSDSLPIVEVCSQEEDKRVYGVYSMLDSPSNFGDKEDINLQYIRVVAIGHTTVLVTDTNGNIEPGDNITTSKKKGYAQHQGGITGADGIYNYTIGKALQGVDWNKIEIDEKLGFKWARIGIEL